MNAPTLLSEKLPPTDTLLAVICHGGELKAATFDGCYFYHEETGNQFALGCVRSWFDMSCYDDHDLPMAFASLHVALNALKSLVEELK